MPSSTPPRRAGTPRRGMGGLLGLLAVLAFLILAAVLLTRRGPNVADAPPASTLAPASTMPAPSEPPPSAPTETPSPAASAEPAPAVAESPQPGKTGRPRRTGAAPATDTRVADATPGGRLPGALPPPAGPAPRRFLLGTTSVESLKPVARELAGFEPGGVGVKRAPEVNGRVELEMDPPHVRPGVDYTVKVYLANDGDKDIPVQELEVSTLENGKTARRVLPSRARTVKPQQRLLLHEIEGVWRESARSWQMDVVVTSARKDVYRNRLRWE